MACEDRDLVGVEKPVGVGAQPSLGWDGPAVTEHLAAARAANDDARYSQMLDWGLRLVVVLALPCAAALLVFATPLIATLFLHGKFSPDDVQRVALALAGYGVGLVGLVAIKVLAPGYYASLDIRTPVKIAVAVLVITQLFNLIFVPLLQHAALTLSIALGAMINALWLLIGLIRRGSYRPQGGWAVFGAQVLGATLLMSAFLSWAGAHVDWLTIGAWQRVGWLTASIAGAMVVSFGALTLRGLKLRAPTRLTNKFIAMLGATPVGMPVPQVGDALSKGVIDGAVVPYEVVPSVKIQELVMYHSDTDPAEAAFYTSTFIFAMNKAKYESLPPDLKKVIDANSGQALSGQIGKAFVQADAEGKKLTTGNTTNVIPAAELANWKKLGDKLSADWVKEMDGKGLPGAKLLDDARALIAKHAAAK